jgi:hypothetical protein
MYHMTMRLYEAASDLGDLASQARMAIQVLRSLDIDPVSNENFIAIHDEATRLYTELEKAVADHHALTQAEAEAAP